MPGPVALVGAGEFLPAMLDFDAGLLAATGRARPRVVILPTASYPDGEDVFQRWASMGVAHFAALGAEVEPVLVRDRDGAADPAACQAVGEADLVYLSGGKPAHLRSTRWTGPRSARRCSTPHERGAVLAGCSAGAMVAGRPRFDVPRRGCCPGRCAGGQGLGFVPGASVIPHYDAWPEPFSALIALQAPRGSVVLGIDEDTAVIGSDGGWQVHGAVARDGLARAPPRALRGGDMFRI